MSASGTPAWGDFITMAGITVMLIMLLRFLQTISRRWTQMMLDRIAAVIAKRKENKNNFRAINGYSWDFVMVFKIKPWNDDEEDLQLKKTDKEKEKDKRSSLKSILNRLADAGLQTKLFYSCQHDEVYCKIRAPKTRLYEQADLLGYPLNLEPTVISNILRVGNDKGPPEKQWAPVDIPLTNDDTEIPPCEYIYAPYDAEHPCASTIYRKYASGSLLRGVDRLKLIASIISGPLSDGGCHIDAYKLITNDNMLGFFPLHDQVELRRLEEKWLRFFQPPWKQHVDYAKDYFGEKIGFYFLWLGHYTTWLLSAAIMGFVAWIVVAAYGNDPNTAFMPFFSVFTALWCTLYLESWKRTQKTHAMRWGMVGFEQTAQVRPEFAGLRDLSPVDGSPMLYFPRKLYIGRLIVSFIVIASFIALVVGAVALTFYIRIQLTAADSLWIGGVQIGGIIASFISSIQITFFNIVYGKVAILLNNYENHRTDVKYEDALIAKTFIFQFVNSFAALFYIAFVKPFITDYDACVISCMKELQVTLGTIFITRLATGSITSVVVPYVQQKLKERDEFKGVEDPSDVSDVERSFLSPEYHVLLGQFQDYAELMIQFGYTTMFIASFPLATVLSFINNYVEMRVDAWKLCQLYRRPEPRSCEDIGTWYTILYIVSVFAVLTNAALIAFTSTVTDSYSWSVRIWIFIGTATGVWLTSNVISMYIPDVPLDVEIQLKRQSYILGKIMDNIKDDDFVDAKKSKKVRNAEFMIKLTDDDQL